MFGLRPVRVIRSAPTTLSRNLHQSPARSSSSHASTNLVQVQPPAFPELDSSFAPLLLETSMKSRRRSRSQVIVKENGHVRDEFQTEEIQRSIVYQRTGLHDHLQDGLGMNNQEMISENSGEDGEYQGERREERRSPAAVLGSKKIGMIILPEILQAAIQKEISQTNARSVREAFLLLQPTTSAATPLSSKPQRKDRKPESTLEIALAKASAFLPGEFAAVRNVLQEMEARLGTGWLNEGDGGVVEYSGGIGAGFWALLDSTGVLSSEQGDASQVLPLLYQLVHPSRHGLQLAKTLTQDLPGTGVEVQFHRKMAEVQLGVTPTLALSTFHLSTLPTSNARLQHLDSLLALESPYIILVDRSTPSGWAAISQARSHLLSKSSLESPLHVLAPCPHDGDCPLVKTRDFCSFRQKLQRPAFLRRTKHSTKGEELIGYCYLVIARGERPVREISDAVDEVDAGQTVRKSGRVGGVGKEEIQKSRMQMEGRYELKEIEGGNGEFELVDLASPSFPVVSDLNVGEGEKVQEDVMDDIRREAYSWPRLVAPPLKRSGHVVIDACCSNEHIQRLTFSKSQSKQIYHDARKSSWGDIFPHDSKGKEVVRNRGVKRLSKHDEEAVEISEWDNLNWPVAEFEEMDGSGTALSEEDLMASMGETEDADFEVTNSSGGRSSRRTDRGSGKSRRYGSKRGERHAVQEGLTMRRGLSTSARIDMSARPQERKPDSQPRQKVTLNELNSMKSAKVPITCLTAYDYPTALLSEATGIDMCLVGDSLSQVALGHPTTTQITLEEMIHHCKAVTRGAKTPFVYADLPFGSFEKSIEQGMESAIRLVKEGGVDGVKIEGGKEIIPLIKKLSQIGIPVMPHVGLQPQRATALSGYLVQAKTSDSANQLFETTKMMEEAGAFGILLEAIPHNLAKYVTENLGILTIGIGAGPGTCGQVLVISDVLGLYESFDEDGKSVQPRFVRQFGELGRLAKQAVGGYVREVKGGTFPEIGKETYGMKKEEWEGFLKCQSKVFLGSGGQ